MSDYVETINVINITYLILIIAYLLVVMICDII